MPEFKISTEISGAIYLGHLKLTNEHVIFKNSKTGKINQLSFHEFDNVNWLKLVGSYGLRLILKNGSLYRFFGFKNSEKDEITKYFQDIYNIDLIVKELNVKGCNWGSSEFLKSVLSINNDNLPIFEIPLKNVSQCTTGKNEIALEFHQNDDESTNLVEMRFHIPPSELTGNINSVEAFKNKILKEANIIVTDSGNTIAVFPEIQILAPRGRYDIKIFPTFFQLHGKTFDYKIPLSTIIRIFLLPHTDGRQQFLVLNLDPPIRQGQTRYFYLVLQFCKRDEITVELPFTEEEINTKYEGKITKELSGSTYEIIAKLLKVMTNKKLTCPYICKSNSGPSAISCSYKATAGFLYLLERAFIFVPKSPIHMRFEEIVNVNFARSGGNTKSFDFEIEMKTGVVNTFNSIEKGEYGKLFDFIEEKKLRVRNRGKLNAENKNASINFENSDVEDEPDAYLESVKREGEENDDESSDEDFNLSADENSEIEDEYDSNVTNTDSDSNFSKKENSILKNKKQEKNNSKKEKSTKTSNSESTRKRKRNDPNKPKKPLSAYMIWINENREKIKEENPGIKFLEISKKGGEMWRNISKEEKEKYDKKAKSLKEEYLKTMAEYEKNINTEIALDDSKSVKSSQNSKKSNSKSSDVSQAKVGTGSNYTSREFIETDGSSSENDTARSNIRGKKKLNMKNSNNIKRKIQELSSDEDKNRTLKKKKEDSDLSITQNGHSDNTMKNDGKLSSNNDKESENENKSDSESTENDSDSNKENLSDENNSDGENTENDSDSNKENSSAYDDEDD